MSDKPISQQTFIIIKPDGFVNNDFLEEFENLLEISGLSLTQEKVIDKLDIDKLTLHYEHIFNQPFFNNVVEYMQSGYVMIGIVEGPYAVDKVRSILGKTDPREAEKSSLRGKYGKVENGYIMNVCHASDSVSNAQREIKIWYGNGDSNE